MILGFHHVAISTSDLERSCQFYCDLLGFKRVLDMGYERTNTPKPHLQSDDGAVKAAVVKAGNVYLEIVEYSYPVPNPLNPDRRVVDHGLAHICFQITDLKAEYAKLVEAGMEFHSSPLEAGHGSNFIYGRDPDGNVIELIELGRTDPFPSVYETNSCCNSEVDSCC